MKSVALLGLLMAAGCWSSSSPNSAPQDGGLDVWAPDVGEPPPDGWGGPDAMNGPDGWDLPDVWGSPDVWSAPDAGGPDGWSFPDAGGPDIWSAPDAGGPDIWSAPDAPPIACVIPESIELTGLPSNSQLCSLVAYNCLLTPIGGIQVRFSCDGTTGTCTLNSDCTCEGTFNPGGFNGTSSFDFTSRRFRGRAAGVSCEWTFVSR